VNREPRTDAELVAALAQVMRDHDSIDAWAALPGHRATVPFVHFAEVAVRWLQVEGLLAGAPPATVDPVASESKAHGPGPRRAMGTNCAAHIHHDWVPLEVHHVHPIGRGGKDVRGNRLSLCSNAHSAVHDALLKIEKAGEWLRIPYAVRRHYGLQVRRIALAGWAAYADDWKAGKFRGAG
jgi:HNH endonuclease